MIVLVYMRVDRRTQQQTSTAGKPVRSAIRSIASVSSAAAAHKSSAAVATRRRGRASVRFSDGPLTSSTSQHSRTAAAAEQSDAPGCER